MKVLLIEDDKATAQTLANVLRANNIVCDIAENASAGEGALRCAEYDIVLVDIVLPDRDGFELVASVRKAFPRIPILVLSGLSDVRDRVEALNIGADDYLAKPFHKVELLARMDACLRRSSTSSASPVVAIGDLRVDFCKKAVFTSDDKRIEFTDTEYSMLEVMVRRLGSLVNKKFFIDQLYSSSKIPEEKIIDVYICKIRAKIRKALGTAKNFYLHTVWGSGYYLEYDPSKQSVAKNPQKGLEIKKKLKHSAAKEHEIKNLKKLRVQELA